MRVHFYRKFEAGFRERSLCRLARNVCANDVANLDSVRDEDFRALGARFSPFFKYVFVRPPFREHIIPTQELQTFRRVPKTRVIPGGVSVSDDRTGKVEYFGADPQHAKPLMLRFALVKHRIARVEIEVHVIVQRPSARHDFPASSLLDFRHGHGTMNDFLGAAVRQQSVLKNGWHVGNGRDVVQLVDVVPVHAVFSHALGFFEAGADQRDHRLIDRLPLARRQPQHVKHQFV